MNSTRYSTPYWNIFGGVLCSSTKCQRPGCGKESRTYDPLDRISLELPGDGRSTTIEEALEAHFSSEPLVGEGVNDFCLEGCGYRDCRARKLSVSRWPQVLCIHLKRLVRLPPDYTYRKIATDVAFLPEFVPEFCKALEEDQKMVETSDLLATLKFDANKRNKQNTRR